MEKEGEDLKKRLKGAGIEINEVANKLGMTRQNLGYHFRKEIVDLSFKKKLFHAYPEIFTNAKYGENKQENGESIAVNDLEVKRKGVKSSNNSNNIANDDNLSNSLLIGEVPGPGEETNMMPLGNNKYGMIVPLVPLKAYAGYLDNFGNQEFYEQLDKHNVTVIGNFRGRYFAFVVKGDSMENWTSEEFARRSIPEGAIVTGREIPQHHWRNKLHLHRFQFYVIVHNEGIITKEIIEHNTTEGYIICHSLNPDKKQYPDKKIFLDDCKQILNIVDKSLPI